ncbi:MAG: DotU family type IV/VI secretion system protein [Planctomycetota bacterium]
MTPEFSSAVDPIFLVVLEALEQIETGRAPRPDTIMRTVRDHIDRAETQLAHRGDWPLAKYAIAGWVDEVFNQAPWEGSRWWEEHKVEVQLFKSRDAFHIFFQRAAEATGLANKDALEVFYICGILGFRGIYRDTEHRRYLAELGLPDSMEEWIGRTSLSLQLGQDRPALVDQPRPVPGAPPLEGKYLMIGSLIFTVLSMAVAAFMAYRMFWISDDAV